MEDKTISIVSAVASSIGAVSSTLALVGGAIGAVLTIRRRQRIEESKWHLNLGMRLPEGYRAALVRFGDEKAFLIRAIEVLSPVGARIVNQNRGAGRESLGRRCEPEAIVRQHLRYNSRGEAHMDAGLLPLLVQIPPRPAASRSSRTRLRISVIAEEVSAQRRQIKICVTSQEIDWIAKQTDIHI